MTMAGTNDRWSDLRPRVLSALVMVTVGGFDIWAGGVLFALMVVAVIGGMMWELSRLTAGPGRNHSLWLGGLAALALAFVLWSDAPWAILALVVPPLAGLFVPRRDRVIFFLYALVILGTGLSLVAMRLTLGLAPFLWLLAVVVVSDILGYFVGRILGGPKFWPAISPKKTWSGTAAGWIGAAAVGLGFWAFGTGTVHLLWASPLIAFAGQMGDIAESAIKRRAGVKDASSLIPGHGGLMDRFDALAFAAIVTAILHLLVPLFPLVKV